MRDDAVEIIINHIILYKDYNNTETLNLIGRLSHQV